MSDPKLLPSLKCKLILSWNPGYCPGTQRVELTLDAGVSLMLGNAMNMSVR